MESHPLPLLPSWRVRGWIIAGFMMLTCAAYLYPMKDSIFVAWDDTYLIYFNPTIKEITWKSITTAFTTFDPELYVPLTLLSYQLDHLIGGLNPFFYHFTNLLLHTANSLFVAWFLFLLSRRPWVALPAGLLFAIHPLHTEAVMWASARKDVLSTFFFLLSLIAYLHCSGSSRRRSYILSLVFFLLGLLSKVMVLMLPFVLILLDIRGRRTWHARMILEKGAYLGLSILFGGIALFGKRDTVQGVTLLDTILMACKSTVFYLQKLFLPTNLSVLYPYERTISITSLDVLVPLIIVSLLIIATLASLRWTREILFGVGFFLLTLIPTFMNFSKGGDLYFASDRYAYVPSIGILYLVALLLERFRASAGAMREQVRRSPVCIGALAAVLAIFLTLSFRQAQTWSDSIALFTQTLRLYPRAMAAHLNIAMVYREMNDIGKVKEHLLAAEKIRPHPRTHVALATIAEREGDRIKAFEEYQKAISLNPKDPEPYFGLGILYEREGQTARAIELYQKVLSIDPKYVGTYNNLAAIEFKRGNLEGARQYYEQALDSDPYFADGHFNLGLIAKEEGETEEAIRSLERAVQLDPKNALDALETLLDLYAMKNDVTHAADAAERILWIDPAHRTAKGFLEALRGRGMLQ